MLGCLTLCRAAPEECMGAEEVHPFTFQATGSVALSFERGGRHEGA